MKATAHNYNDLIPEDMALRFASRDGDLPKTSGDAVKARIANPKQKF